MPQSLLHALLAWRRDCGNRKVFAELFSKSDPPEAN